MAYRHCDNTGVVRRGVAAFAFVAMYALSGSSAPAPSSSAPSTLSSDRKTVTLSFVDSAMVNDTVIRLGDIAKVSSNDAALAAAFRAFAATEAAPAGYSRFVNSDDLVIFSVRPKFKGVEVVTANQKRVKVASDYQTRAIGEFIEQINSYAAERLAWASGEWSLAVANPQNSWKSGRGPVSAEVSGIDNPLAKGNIGLTLTVRQGSRVARIPVACKITVKAPVLTASRMIQRGEELTEENSKMQVTDITTFAYIPLRELPKSGTVTALRSVAAGGILHDRMLRAIPVVARGDQVRIHYIGERVKISVLGVARDNGGSGERIWVENLQTGKLIRAAVSGKGSVVVHQEGERS